jgi:hypothetical protein
VTVLIRVLAAIGAWFILAVAAFLIFIAVHRHVSSKGESSEH